MLQLKWVETGGPPVEKAAHKGFGSMLIERGLSHQLDGKAELDLDRERPILQKPFRRDDLRELLAAVRRARQD